ncbi:serine/threonine protein kinase [Colletotrichum salicis]|uniref:Serine/threonine protein kinase n=1 Tax=Colletotrichum salicis TaxID=1209931 RepID=A0A135V4L4_9PEZI|nr:serine/threonine protein kinase [Colletotrichum salicis]
MSLLEGTNERSEIVSDGEGSLPTESPSSISDHVSSDTNQTYQPEATSSPLSSSVSDDSLEERINRNLHKTDDEKDFLPADTIDAFTSRSIVEEELKAHVTSDMEQLSSLVAYVMNPDLPARRLFLILVVCDDLKRLQDLANAPQKFHDVDLPVKVVKGPSATVYSMESIEGDRKWPLFSSRRKGTLDSFFHSQWQFLAPIFAANCFRHKLHPSCPLPFVVKINHQKAGFFSSVFEVVIHDAHQKVLPMVKGKNIRVASKEMRIGMDSYYEKEADILETIRNVDNPHLIKPLAAYRRGDLRGFLFPWGEGGNLKEFWGAQEKLRPMPVKDPFLVLWVLRQLQGICGSISALHERNCRHGDLKPENILHFLESDSKGILRVADVGLARFHLEATRDRNQPTNTMTGTVRYEPPEFGLTEQISRLYDVWSLGCVFLEFLIWVLYGNSKLRDFNRASIEEKFWSKDNDGYHQHREVKIWISRMSKDLRRNDSTSNTSLKDVLELIDLNMLVPEVEGRTNSTKLYERLRSIFEQAEGQEDYLLDSTLWSRISTSAVPAEHKRSKLEVPGQRPPPGRVSSSQDLQPALLGLTPDVPITDTPTIVEPNAETGDVSMQVPIPNAQEQLDNFRDVWELESDSNFASEFYRKSASPLPTLQVSTLCRTCMGYDIWTPMFLVFQSAESLGMKDGDELKFRREGSSLKIDPDGPTILSLYVNPATNSSTPPHAQIGFPTLPETGSSQQFILLNEWLRVCDEQHNHGIDSRTELPTRVLDVGTDPNSTIRLCDGKALPLERYIALSHCWGLNSQAQVRTLKENINAFRVQIDFGILPKSFQDTVKITRALGLRYLWIDSLCIIQNDKQDWAFEATRMEHVFSSAYCTIAATAASSSAEGFLRQKAQHPFVTLKGRNGGFNFVRKSIDDFHQDVEQAVLNQRGWVLQERALSRRTLHFTGSQVYWECGKGVHCESLMRLSNRQAALLGDSDFPKSALEYFKGGRIVTFQTLYHMYSRLAFTVPSDRSIGIKGLEERLPQDDTSDDADVQTTSDAMFAASITSASEDKGFLPFDALRRIVTPSAVQRLLGHAFPHFKPKVINSWVSKISGKPDEVKAQPQRRKIFAILILMEQVKLIEDFIKHNVDDSSLPLEIKRNTRHKPVIQLQKKDGSVLNCLNHWRTKHINNFVQCQETICTPFFKLPGNDVHYYEITSKTVLPFQEYDLVQIGGYGSDRGKVLRHFAVKQLHLETYEEYAREVELFERLGVGSRGPEPDHLIQLQITYKYGQSYYLVFPWADGNLREFWSKTVANPGSRAETVWFLSQCLGLVRALRRIHNLRTMSKEDDYAPVSSDPKALLDNKHWGRHGDIKPENILWFKKYEESRRNFLVISDFGLTRFNSADSRSKVAYDAVRGFSGSYRPPDVDLKRTISQRYDIWSLGCVFLEFVSWFLVGHDRTQQEFTDARVREDGRHTGSILAEDKFFNFNPSSDVTPSTAEVKLSVASVSVPTEAVACW